MKKSSIDLQLEVLDILYTVLPILEDAEDDPGYDKDYMSKVTARVRAAIKQAEK